MDFFQPRQGLSGRRQVFRQREVQQRDRQLRLLPQVLRAHLSVYVFCFVMAISLNLFIIRNHGLIYNGELQTSSPDKI